MKKLHLIALVTVSWTLAACTDSPVLPAASHGNLVHAKLPQGATDGGSAVAVAVEAKVDGSGMTTGRISATSNVAQTLTADAASGIGKAALTIPAGTVGVDLDVGLTAGVPVATAEMAAELGLDQPAAIAAAGPSVLVSVSAPLVGTVTLSLPLDASLALADDAAKLERLIVLYRIVKDGKTIAGFLPKSAFVLENGVALVPIGVGGLYQLGYSAVVQVIAKSAETKAPVQSKVEAKKAEAATDKPATAVAVVWEKIDIAADKPQRKVKIAAVHSGTVRACRIETETSTPSGVATDQREVDGTQALITLTAPVSLKFRARFRCFDEAGKETISPWSADVSMAEVCFQVAARDADGDGVFAPWNGPLCGFAALPAEYAQTPVSGIPDCDDGNAAKFQMWNVFADADGDGFGTGAQIAFCAGATPPAGYAPIDGDAFPNDPLLHGFGAFLGAVGGSANDAIVDVREDSAGNRYYLVNFHSAAVDADPGPGTATVNHTGEKATFVTKIAANGAYQWTRSFGGSGQQGVTSSNMRIAPDDTIVVAGEFYGTIDFDGVGPLSPRTSYDPGGWYFAPESFVLKLSSTGAVLWVHNAYHGGDDSPYGLAIIPGTGEIVTGGYFYSLPIDLNPGSPGGEHNSVTGQDCYLLKLDANGAYITSVSFGGAGDDAVMSLTVTTDGKLWATGRFEYGVDFGLNSGDHTRTALAGQDIFILRTSAALSFDGVIHIAGTGDDRSHLIAADPRGGAVITGHFTSSTIDLDPLGLSYSVSRTGSEDLWIAAYTETMAFRWGGVLNTVAPNDPESGGLVVAADGSTYYAGFATNQVDFDLGLPGAVRNGVGGMTDLFLMRITPGGLLDWFRTYGEVNQHVRGGALSLTSSGSLLVTAGFEGGMPIKANFLDGLNAIAPVGAKDGFAIRID